MWCLINNNYGAITSPSKQTFFYFSDSSKSSKLLMMKKGLLPDLEVPDPLVPPPPWAPAALKEDRPFFVPVRKKVLFFRSGYDDVRVQPLSDGVWSWNFTVFWSLKLKLSEFTFLKGFHCQKHLKTPNFLPAAKGGRILFIRKPPLQTDLPYWRGGFLIKGGFLKYPWCQKKIELFTFECKKTLFPAALRARERVCPPAITKYVIVYKNCQTAILKSPNQINFDKK